MKNTALLLACLFLSANALSQQWPQKPVKVIVPFPPGGVTDSLARITADWLTPRLGQPVIAENRPGASGAIAAEFVARADADGYTLFSAATPQLAIVPHVQKVSYDPLKDFAPISIVGTNPFALGCNEKLPPKNLTEFVAYAKERPGQLSFASPGSGSVGHLTMALFLARAGAEDGSGALQGRRSGDGRRGGRPRALLLRQPERDHSARRRRPHQGIRRLRRAPRAAASAGADRRRAGLSRLPHRDLERLRRPGRDAAPGDRAHRARDRRRLQGRRVRRAPEQDRRRRGVRHAGRVRAGDPRRPRHLEGSRPGGGKSETT